MSPRAPRARLPGPASGEEEISGTLLTLDYETVAHRTWLRLTVRTPGGPRVVLDGGFEPYFWALPEADERASEVAQRLSGLRAGGATVVRAEVEERTWEGERREVIRVVLQHPGHTPALREIARGVEGVERVLEADIPFAMRYAIDRELVPLGPVRIVASREAGIAHPVARRIAVPPEAREADAPVEISLLAFDIEVANPSIVPIPERDPVVVIALAGPQGVEALSADGEDGEPGLLRRFVARVRDLDPDVLLTYNGDGFDWPYLLERARRLGVRLAVGRDGSEPTLRQAGPFKAAELRGRVHVDLLRVAQRDVPDVKVKTLVNVADALGAMAREERTHLAGEEIHRHWIDPGLRPELLAYAEEDVLSTLRVGEALLPLQIELARRIRLPLDDVSRMGRGRQVDFYLLQEAYARGILAPGRHHGGESADDVYEGGFVMEPPEGLVEDVVALDFSAMYPSIMVAYNVSPDTLVRDGDGAPGDHVAPEVGHRFRASPPGFFTSLLRDLLRRRREVKRQAANAGAGSERDLLAVRQSALKILANAFYGYTGWPEARWYSRECAEATAAWGRSVIRDVMEMARLRGIDVLYGDTDSLFVRDDARVAPFARDVSRKYPLDLDVEERFSVVFFTGAKKRYAGVTKDGRTVVRGLEVRRGDWCALARNLQQEVLDDVLRRRDPGAAARRVLEAVQGVRDGTVPLEALTIHKTLGGTPGSYKTPQPHAQAVERARRERPGYHPPVGAKIGYVVLDRPGGPRTRGGRGEDKVHERAKVADFLEPGDRIDAEYYVRRQVVPAAFRILEHFGYTEDELMGAPRQRRLTEF